MNTMRKALGLIITSVFIGAPGAHACSGYALDIDQSGMDIYNPVNVTETIGKLRLSIQGALPEANCASLPVTISALSNKVDTFRSGNDTLSGSRPASSQVLASFANEITLTTNARQQLVSNGTLELDFIQFEPGLFAPQGQYSSQLSVAVDGMETDTDLISFGVPASVRLVEDSSSGVGKIDFGQLESGLSRSTSFFYQTNASVAISAVSDNGGYLVHEGGPDMGQISYSARIMGQPVNTDGTQEISVSPATGVTQAGMLQVIIGNVENPYSGKYRDILTLNFRAF